MVLGPAITIGVQHSRLVQQFFVHQFAELHRQGIAHSVVDKLTVLVACNNPGRCQQRKML